MTSRATVNQECIEAYNSLKLNKKYKYIIFKLSDDFKEIVVESTSDDAPEYDDFREKLVKAQSKTKSVCSPGRPLESCIICRQADTVADLASRALCARVPVTPSTTSSTSSRLGRASGRSTRTSNAPSVKTDRPAGTRSPSSPGRRMTPVSRSVSPYRILYKSKPSLTLCTSPR